MTTTMQDAKHFLEFLLRNNVLNDELATWAKELLKKLEAE